MRRTTVLQRSLVMSAMFLSLTLGVLSTFGAGTASAQQPKELAGPGTPVLVVPINTTKRVNMSKKQQIAVVQNENPKVCRVQAIADDPTAVLITGLAAGTSRVTFTDAAKNS